LKKGFRRTPPSKYKISEENILGTQGELDLTFLLISEVF
jgi:hypothetical protein